MTDWRGKALEAMYESVLPPLSVSEAARMGAAQMLPEVAVSSRLLPQLFPLAGAKSWLLQSPIGQSLLRAIKALNPKEVVDTTAGAGAYSAALKQAGLPRVVRNELDPARAAAHKAVQQAPRKLEQNVAQLSRELAGLTARQAFAKLLASLGSPEGSIVGQYFPVANAPISKSALRRGTVGRVNAARKRNSFEAVQHRVVEGLPAKNVRQFSSLVGRDPVLAEDAFALAASLGPRDVAVIDPNYIANARSSTQLGARTSVEEALQQAQQALSGGVDVVLHNNYAPELAAGFRDLGLVPYKVPKRIGPHTKMEVMALTPRLNYEFLRGLR